PLPRRGTAGPPGRAGAARHNLPMPISSFVGREQELGEVTRQLAGARLLTLTGVGGCGKTRLALEVARAVLGRYPDGVWLVELGAELSMADLARNPAVQLFSTRATAAQARFALTVRNAAAVAQICRHLDGLPLALELAAARIEALTAEQLAARLDQGFRLLTG